MSHYQTRRGEITPYVRVNQWQGLGGTDHTHFQNNATTTLYAGQRYGSTEVATGVTWAVKPTVQLYGEIGREWSNGGQQSEVSRDVSGSIGIKASF